MPAVEDAFYRHCNHVPCTFFSFNMYVICQLHPSRSDFGYCITGVLNSVMLVTLNGVKQLSDISICLLQITPSLSSSGPHEDNIRHFLENDVVSFIRKQLAVYIKKLKEEFSKGLILPTEHVKLQAVSKGKTVVHRNVDKKAFQNHVVCFFQRLPNFLPRIDFAKALLS